MNDYAIGLSSCGFSLTDENFAKLRESGVAAIELSMPHSEYPKINYLDVLRLSERYGVKLWSYHLPFTPFDTIDPSSPSKEIRKHTIAYFSELIGKAAEIGIGKFIIHPSKEPVHSAERSEHMKCAMESLDRLAEISDRAGAVLAPVFFGRKR